MQPIVAHNYPGVGGNTTLTVFFSQKTAANLRVTDLVSLQKAMGGIRFDGEYDREEKRLVLRMRIPTRTRHHIGLECERLRSAAGVITRRNPRRGWHNS